MVFFQIPIDSQTTKKLYLIIWLALLTGLLVPWLNPSYGAAFICNLDVAFGIKGMHCAVSEQQIIVKFLLSLCGAGGIQQR